VGEDDFNSSAGMKNKIIAGSLEANTGLIMM
jgi:hypothetical protein